MKKLLYIVLLLISPEIFANLFTPTPGDESLNLLAIIFGPTLGSIPLDSTGSVKINQAIIDVMTQLNVVVVAIGTIICSYVGIMSTINTAHEGAVMGKKWSAVWIPMRSVAGMALLIPSSGAGYSMIQVTVMYIVVNGVGAADFMWNIILTDLSGGDSIVSGSSAPAAIPAASATANTFLSASPPGLGLSLLNAITCMQTLKTQASSDPNNLGQWLGNNGGSIVAYLDSTTPTTAMFNNNVKVTSGSVAAPIDSVTVSNIMHFGVNDQSLGPNGYPNICGSIYISGTATCKDYSSSCTSTSNPLPASLDYQGKTLTGNAGAIYAAKLLAVQSIQTNLQTQVLTPIINGAATQSTAGAPPGVTLLAQNLYNSLVSITVPTAQSNPIQTAIATGKANGWVAAGAYYFVFAQSTTSSLFKDDATPPTVGTIAYASGNADNIPSCTGTCSTGSDASHTTPLIGLGDVSNVPTTLNSPAQAMLAQLYKVGVTSQDTMDALSRSLSNAYLYWSNDSGQNPNTPLNIPGGASAGPLSQFLAPLAALDNAVISGIIGIINGGNPDPLIAHSLFGQGLMGGCEAAWILMWGASMILSMPVGFMGFGIPTFTIILGFLTIISGFIGSLWVLGSTLAVYCPLIPFLIFTMGVIGWMITVTEAIFGAPMIALSLVVPSQDEMGEIKAALMILANIFLRPTLMILGFAFAGKLYKAAVTLVGFGFGATLNAINVGTLFSPLVVLGIYTAFIVSLTNNCFALIYILPDKILRWMGGSEHQSDMSSVSDAKAGGQAGAAIAKGEGEGIGKAAGKRAYGTEDKPANNAGTAAAASMKKKLGEKASSAASAIKNKLGR